LAQFDSLDIDEHNNQCIEANEIKRVLRGIIYSRMVGKKALTTDEVFD
jgi:hypothetical protein